MPIRCRGSVSHSPFLTCISTGLDVPFSTKMSAWERPISPLQTPTPNCAAAKRSPFLGDELSAGGLGCGNDLVEALIAAQRIPARIEAEIAI
jgi:hypothetical protein